MRWIRASRSRPTSTSHRRSNGNARIRLNFGRKKVKIRRQKNASPKTKAVFSHVRVAPIGRSPREHG
ncbi:hypothetical protein AJ87_19955 [Rhizobium yanglingense]|nr:hypothetical protein AJ87_19955 [Rhizobium yanglingense]